MECMISTKIMCVPWETIDYMYIMIYMNIMIPMDIMIWHEIHDFQDFLGFS